MNPMVFTILAWEREMQVRRQTHWVDGYDPLPDRSEPDDPAPRREALKSILNHLPQSRRTSPSNKSCPPVHCECS
ncbi:MAG: hypothetical protein P8Z00_12650 [Anaerolineales bacterium]|jgi:hypothetical protein